MWSLYYSALRAVNGFDLQDWLIAFVVAVALGSLCLKGFGSRARF